jgi:PAS domain S-box-containing protein
MSLQTLFPKAMCEYEMVGVLAIYSVQSMVQRLPMNMKRKISLAFAMAIFLLLGLCLGVSRFLVGELVSLGFIYSIGLDTVLLFLGCFAFAGLSLIVLLWLYLNKILFTRLSKIIFEVMQIRRSADSKMRFSVEGDDELSHMCTELNGMLDALDYSRSRLLQANRKLSNVVSNLPGVVFEITLNPEDDLRFYFIGKRGKKFLGYDLDSMVQDTSLLCRRIERGRRDRLGKTLVEAVKCQKSWNDTIRVYDSDGGLRWLRVSCQPRCISSGQMFADGVALDVTEHRRAEIAVEHAAREWRTAFDALTDCILVLDEDMRVKRCNRAFIKFVGKDFDEVIGRPYAQLVRGDGGLAIRLCKQVSKVKSRVSETVEIQQKAFEYTVEPIIEGNGDLLGVVLVMSDITEKRMLEKEILRVSEDERRQIGRDIHDSLGQKLTGVALQCKTLSQRLQKKASEEAEVALELTRQVNGINSGIRALAHGLYPASCDSEGLVGALRELTSYTENALGVECDLICEDGICVESDDVAIQLYRIAQEAINNAIRHGGARALRVTLSQEDHVCKLEIADDGCGLPDNMQNMNGNGIGIKIMNYRASVIGGELILRESSSGGTKVVCKFKPENSSNI